jgi:hypothetical protein
MVNEMNDASAFWITGLLTVAAIFAAPITVLWVQGKRDEKQALRLRRERIFKALWVNRRRQFYVARVDALNMIDIEFFGEQKVIDAWQDLFAHYVQEHPGLNDEQIFREREEKFATLLFEVSQVLGYKFGRTGIRDNIYRPILHGEFDNIEFETRRMVHELLKSDALPVRFVPGTTPPNPPPPPISETTVDAADEKHA